MKKEVFLLISLLACINVFAESAKGYYAIELVSVERNGTKCLQGIKMINNESDFPLATFSDEKLSFTWEIQLTHFNLSLENKSDKTIRVDWENSAYVNSLGNNFRVFHSGITIADRDREQMSTPIVRGSKLRDLVVPTGNVSYSTYFNRWVYLTLLDNKKGSEDNTNVRIQLSIKDNDGAQDYIFIFNLKYIKRKVKTVFRGGLVEYVSVR